LKPIKVSVQEGFLCIEPSFPKGLPSFSPSPFIFSLYFFEKKKKRKKNSSFVQETQKSETGRKGKGKREREKGELKGSKGEGSSFSFRS